MSIYITKTPGVTISTNEGNISSNLVPLKNKTIFELTRKDFNVQFFIIIGTVNAGKIKVRYSGTLSAIVGDYIYLVNSIYTGKFQILSKYTSGSIQYIELDCPFTIQSTGGYFNDIATRENYYLSVALYANNTNLLYQVGSDIKLYLDNKGVGILDLTNRLNDFLNDESENDYSNQVFLPTDFCYFAFQVLEVFDNYTGEYVPATIGEANVYFGINASVPFYEQYRNLFIYYMYYDFVKQNKNKFLTRFEEPQAWRDYPFTLSAHTNSIVDETDTIYNISAVLDFNDLNNAEISSDEVDLGYSIERLVEIGIDWALVPINCEFIEMFIQLDAASETTYVNYGYVLAGYVE
jgi:hypothetical protein